MKYRVHITRTADGVTRICPQPYDWSKGDHDDSSWWADGNMSCDCNRELEFARSADEDEPDVSCSDGRFKIYIIELEDGTIIKGPDAE